MDSNDDIYIDTSETFSRQEDTLFIEYVTLGNKTYYLPLYLMVIEIPPVILIFPNKLPFMEVPPKSPPKIEIDLLNPIVTNFDVTMSNIIEDEIMSSMKFESATFGNIEFTFAEEKVEIPIPIQSKTTSTIMTFDVEKMTLNFNLEVTKELIGRHKIKLRMIDNELGKTIYEFDITFVLPVSELIIFAQKDEVKIIEKVKVVEDVI